jgi:hypothetical protein
VLAKSVVEDVRKLYAKTSDRDYVCTRHERPKKNACVTATLLSVSDGCSATRTKRLIAIALTRIIPANP